MQNKPAGSLKSLPATLSLICALLIAAPPLLCRADDAAPPLPASQTSMPVPGTAGTPLLELPTAGVKSPTPVLPPLAPVAPPPTAAAPSPAPGSVPAAAPMAASATLPGGNALPPEHNIPMGTQNASAEIPGGVPLAAPAVPPATTPVPVTDTGLQSAGGPPMKPNIQGAKEPETGFTPRLLSVASATMVSVLEEPVNIPADFSLMFTRKEMQTIVEPSLVLYDKSAEAQVKSGGAQAGEDLTGLLESLKIKGDSKQAIKPPAPPNLYLGSIVYYSPANWSVWINGKKIVARLNSEKNVLFVSKIDRSEIMLVWRPSLFRDVVKSWNPDAHSKFVSVDEKNSTITLRMHPNQTFVPASMTVNEGLIIQKETATQAAMDAASPILKPESEATALGKAIRNHN